MTVFNVTLSMLTPLHIGNGDELRQDFDFVVHNQRTYLLNEDVILQEKEGELIPDRMGNYLPPGKLVKGADFQNKALFRYILAGTPSIFKNGFTSEILHQGYL